MAEPILAVNDLKVHFPVFKGFIQRLFGGGNIVVHAVDGVNFSIEQGEVFGLVGESGCGKSTIAKALVGLVKPTSGKILFRGTDVTDVSKEERFQLRQQIQVIYQDPHAALNPAMTAGQAIADVMRTHGVLKAEGNRAPAENDEALREEVYHILEDVGLRPAKQIYDKYPSEMSGGQNQRVIVGRVLALRPRLVIADEPVAMLDMSIRAHMLQFLLDLREKYGLTYLFITHDLATAKFVCDRIAIMYLGRLVEVGRAAEVYADPKHPYTRALLQAIPVADPEKRHKKELPKGEVPDAVNPPAGCRFHPRCPVALPTCGWEGRDFIDYMEERRLGPERLKTEEAAFGPIEKWWAEGLEVGRPIGKDAGETLVARVRDILQEAPLPMAEAVREVTVFEGNVVVRFKPPAALAPQDVGERKIECLLY